MDEMTAKLTASFRLADLGIAHHPREDHAGYVASWLNVLKDEHRAIFTVAGKAQAAADWIHTRRSAEQPYNVNRIEDDGRCRADFST
jgi:antirestriction protein ArdC